MNWLEVYLSETFKLGVGDYVILGVLLVLFVLDLVLILRLASNT